MFDGEDGVARGARVVRLDRDFRWPGDRCVAITFNVAFEGWSDGKTPGIGPMGNPLPLGAVDTNALSWAHYGPVRGIERLLGVLERVERRANVMVSGIFAERSPQVVQTIAAAGHDLVAHGYAQEIVPAKLSRQDNEANIASTTELLHSVAGIKPQGWISPRGTPGMDHARLLLEAGYDWHGDAFDDDRPYLQVFPNGGIVAIPLTMEINDLPHAMRYGRSPRQFVEAFEDLLDHVRRGDEALTIDVTAHAHVYGRPAGAWAYEAIARKVRDLDDVWIATRSEIALHVRQVLG